MDKMKVKLRPEVGKGGSQAGVWRSASSREAAVAQERVRSALRTVHCAWPRSGSGAWELGGELLQEARG